MSFTNNPFVLGQTRRFVWTPDAGSAYGTKVAMDANGADHFQAISGSVSYTEERAPRMDSRQTRALLERISRNRTIEWEIEAYLLGGGVAETTEAPAHFDLGRLWASLVGANYNSGADYTSIGSTLCDNNSLAMDLGASAADYDWSTAESSGTLHICTNGVKSDVVTGAVVEEMTISSGDGDEVKVKFSGFGQSHAVAGYATVDSDSTSNNVMQMTTNDTYNFEVGAVVSVGSNTGATTNTGYTITDIDHATGNITLDANVGADAGGVGNAVAAYVSANDSAAYQTGSPVTGVTGTFQLSSATPAALQDMDVVGFELTVKNNHKPVYSRGSNELVDIVVGRREVTGSIQLFGTRDQIAALHRTKSYGVTGINPTITSGFRVELGTMNDGNTAAGFAFISEKAEFDYGFEVPEEGEAVINLPFVCLGSTVNGGAGNGEGVMYLA